MPTKFCNANCTVSLSIGSSVYLLWTYTLGHKNVAFYFCPYLHQLLTNSQNSFTGTLCRQFAIM